MVTKSRTQLSDFTSLHFRGSLPSRCYCSLFSHSVTQSYWTLCNSMDCSKPGFPVLHYLPEFAQTHVHWVSDAIQPSHPLLPPFSSALDLPLHQGLFQWVSSLHQEVLSIRASASASASSLPMNIQGWLPSGLTGFISLQSKGLSRAFSSTTVRNYQFFGISLLYRTTLTSIHDDWKNHSFDSMDICWQKWCLCFLIWSLGMS